MSGAGPEPRGARALVRRLAHSRKAELASGVLLVVCGLLEMVDSQLERLLGLDVGVHHGAIFFGGLQVLRGVAAFLSDELDGILRVTGALDERGAAGEPAGDRAGGSVDA